MSDKLFQKRKARGQTDLRRKQTAQPKETILILCEGKNPECQYLKKTGGRITYRKPCNSTAWKG